MRETGTPATPHPANKTVPTGGVHSPMHRLRTMMIPKWSGSMPRPTATGRKMGVKMRIAGVMSMNVPTTSSTRLMRSSNTMGLSVSPIMPSATPCGIRSNESTHERAIEVATRSMTTAVVTTDRRMTSPRPWTETAR